MMKMIREPLATSLVLAYLVAVLTVGAFLCTPYLGYSPVALMMGISKSPQELASKPPLETIPLNCSLPTRTSCPVDYYPSGGQPQFLPPSATCPEYFRWIHEDLLPWRETGVTREMLMSAKPAANFRLVVVDGKAYVETYQKSFQSRDTFTLWGM